MAHRLPPVGLNGRQPCAAVGRRVAGQDTGRETFNPEWLFNTPGEIEGPVIGPDGRHILSRALRNVAQAYGVDLPACRDRNRDGFPDILGFTPGER